MVATKEHIWQREVQYNFDHEFLDGWLNHLQNR